MSNPFLTSPSNAVKDNSKNPFNKLNSQPVINSKTAEPKTVFNSNPFTTASAQGAVPVATPAPMVKPADPFSSFDIIRPNTNTAGSTPIIDRNAQGPMSAIFGAIRATSDLATLPITVPIAAVSKNLSVKDIVKSTIDMAKSDVRSGGTFSIDTAAQDYLKSKKVGKYGGEQIKPLDVAVLAGLGFANMFGDPALGVGAILPVAKEAKFALQFKKAGSISQLAEEGSKFTQTGRATIDLNKDLKVVVDVNKKEIVASGYIRRGAKGEVLNNPFEIDNIVKETSKSTGLTITPEIKGSDLILRPGAPLAPEIIKPSTQGLSFAGQGVLNQTPQVAEPATSLDFNKTPTPTEHPAITQIRDLAQQNGFKDVAITNTPITDRINNQPAPTGVDLINKTIKIDPATLESDLTDLANGKPITLDNGQVLTNQDEYVKALVNFEKQHLTNVTIEDINNLRSGDEKLIHDTLVSLDERAKTSYAKEFPAPETVKAMDERGADKVIKQEETKKVLNTPEDAAKDMIRSYVLRGDSLKSIKDGQMGQAGGEYDAGIGGYVNGKPIGSDKIAVTKFNGETLKEPAIFSLSKLYEGIKAEIKSPGTYKKGETVTFNKKQWTVGESLKMGKDTKYKLERPGKEPLWTNQLGLDNENVLTQKEQVKESIKKEPKSIKQIADETKIKEPNIRRILGVGAKEGVFERVEKGVYTLSKDGQDLAWIETADATESLPRLAGEGFKADMVFLDIPYDTPAVKGGNRGVKYDLLSVDNFSKILDAVKVIAKSDNSPVIHMFSQAESGLKAMAKYNDLFLEKGFKPVGRGEYQKTFADGSPVTSPNGKVSKPEGIIVFTQSGKLTKPLNNLNFKLVRPKGYQTEKPAEMLKAMIEMTTNEGDLVLDPFAGSGVTGAEAIKAGRQSYNIERNPEVAKNITTPRIKGELENKMATETMDEFSSASATKKDPKTSDFLKSDRNVNDTKTVEDFIISVRAKKVLTDLGIKSAERLQGPRNLGVYKTPSNKARFKSLYDVVTVAHEGAHGVDINNGLIDRAIADKNKDVLPDLRRLYMEYYPNASQSKRVLIQLREGYAELIQNYFTNPNEIAETYPNLIKEFIAPTGKYYHPQVTQLLDGMNSLVEDFQKMTPEQRIGAKMRSGDELVKEDKGFTTKQKIIFETVNYLEPFVRYVKETGTNPFSFANPQLANYNWMNRNAIAGSWIGNKTHSNLIIDSKNNGKLIRRDSGTVKDYLHLIKGKEKEFDEFLIARRVIVDNRRFLALQNKLTIVNNILDDLKLHENDAEFDDKAKAKLEHIKTFVKELEEQLDISKKIIEKDDFNVHDARSVVAKYQKEFEAPTKIHDNIWKNLLEFSYLNNMITHDNYVKWTNEDGYASFKRYVDDDLAASANTNSGSSNFISVSVFKNRGGSALDLVSPVNSQIRAIFEMIPKALENTMWVKTYELTNKTGNRELASRFEAVTPNDPRTAVNDPKLISVKIDGKTRFFRPAKEFAEIRRVMSDKELDTLSQILLVPTRLFTRATTSANPFFLLGNISIDQFSRAYNTEHGTSLTDVGKAFGKFIVNSKEANIQNYKMLGGYGQTFAGSHDVRNLSQNDLAKKITGEGKTKTQKVINALEVTLETIETPSRISEMGTREAEFSKAIKDGMTETEAMWAAANVSVNFGQRGAAFGHLGRFLVKAAPFLNPSIQGTYLFGQKIKAHPRRAAILTAEIMATSLAATILVMENMDDDMKRKLSNVSTTELSKYIFIPMPKIIREKTGIDFAKMKIPEVVGSATGLAQLFVISHYSGNEAKFKDYLNVATSWIPNQINITEPEKMFISWFPQFAKPTIQTIGNFRDYPDVMPILSDTMKNKPLAQQYNNNTSALAKNLGPILGMSPILMDYWIKAQFGAAGKYATQGIGMPSTLMNADQYLTVGRVYQQFFDDKQTANLNNQTVKSSKTASSQELYQADRDNLMFNHIGNTVADISETTKNKLKLPENIKADMNALLTDVTNKQPDVISVYDRLAKVNKEIMQFNIDNVPNMSTDEKLKLMKENLSTERALMDASYEEAYRKYNPTAKPTSELDPATAKLLADIKKKVMAAGGSDADITSIKENFKLETDANSAYKAKQKMLENLPDQVKKANPELYQQAKEEKNALKK